MSVAETIFALVLRMMPMGNVPLRTNCFVAGESENVEPVTVALVRISFEDLFVNELATKPVMMKPKIINPVMSLFLLIGLPVRSGIPLYADLLSGCVFWDSDGTLDVFGGTEG